MVYNHNGMNIAIPDETIERYVNSLDISMAEAIQLYLEDEGYEKNEEQVALNEKAKGVKVAAIINAGSDKPRTKVTRTRKVDDNKRAVFNAAIDFIKDFGGTDVEVVTQDKLLKFKIGEDEFKLDLIKTRKKKEG